MKAELHIRGMREPIDVSVEEAETLQGMMLDASVPNEKPIVILGVWAGKKGDIRYIVFPKKESKAYLRQGVEPMQEPEFGEFEREVQIHADEAEVQMGAGKKFYKKEFWMQKMGAIRLDYYTIPYNGVKSFDITVLNPELNIWCEEKYARYSEAICRKNYASEMRQKELQAMADSIGEGMSMSN